MARETRYVVERVAAFSNREERIRALGRVAATEATVAILQDEALWGQALAAVFEARYQATPKPAASR